MIRLPMSAAALSRMTDVSILRIGFIMIGKERPTEEMAVALSRGYEFPPYWLTNGHYVSPDPNFDPKEFLWTQAQPALSSSSRDTMSSCKKKV